MQPSMFFEVFTSKFFKMSNMYTEHYEMGISPWQPRSCRVFSQKDLQKSDNYVQKSHRSYDIPHRSCDSAHRSCDHQPSTTHRIPCRHRTLPPLPPSSPLSSPRWPQSLLLPLHCHHLLLVPQQPPQLHCQHCRSGSLCPSLGRGRGERRNKCQRESEREKLNISCVFCTYLESRRTLRYAQRPTDIKHTCI